MVHERHKREKSDDVLCLNKRVMHVLLVVPWGYPVLFGIVNSLCTVYPLNTTIGSQVYICLTNFCYSVIFD